MAAGQQWVLVEMVQAFYEVWWDPRSDGREGGGIFLQHLDRSSLLA